MEESIIRLRNAEGKTAGAGFLVSAGLAVTCAHVAAAAGVQPGEMVSTRFEFIESQTPVQALVIADAWSPQQEEGVAFLQLPKTPACSRPVIQLHRHGSRAGRVQVLVI